MYNDSGDPTVTDCTFSDNSAGSGGGMYNFDGSSPAITDCAFSDNSADDGGGMYNDDSSPVVTNCTFSGNSADDGGGMLNDDSSPTMTNCTFTGNSANDDDGSGGGMYNIEGSVPTVTNCAFSDNSAGFGGGIYNFNGNPVMTNCILWGNNDSGGMGESAQIHTDSGNPTVNYSIVQGGWSGTGGTGVADLNPLFADPDGPDDIPGSEDDDLRLMPGSPAIDAGANDAIPPDTADLDGDGNTNEPTPLDLDGNPRFLDVLASPNCPHGDHCGANPLVDMGPYELLCFFSGDADDDSDVDLFDYQAYLDCAGDPGDPPTTACNAFDADCDGDVDFADFRLFQLVSTGP
jgi:hypothetical protein